jgi:large subunit ribosomal protein L31
LTEASKHGEILRSQQHPMAKASKYKYFPSATVKDELDGSIYTLGMTSETLTVEISGNTHPYYTGQETLIDTAGRIDKFKARQAGAKATTAATKTRATKGKQKQSLADMMKQDSLESKAEKKVTKKKVVAAPVETAEEVAVVEAPVAEKAIVE